MKSLILHIAALCILSSALCAQMRDVEVKKRLSAVHNGKLDEVRAELSALEKQYPNDAGVKYLDAYTTRDGAAAAKKYQAIADQFPQSEWADDALYRVSQYYYSAGLYKTAEQKMEELKKQYPNSIYAQRDMNVEASPETKPIEVQQAAVEQKPEQKIEKKSEPPIDQQTGTTPVVRLPSGSFVVQVGVFSLEVTANTQARTISATAGKEAIVFLKTSGGKQVYAIGFDGFETEQSARNFMTELKSKYNIDAFLVKR